ncbi:MAG: S-isoprenylcysteine methyltransferase [Deltaproteobacteria bacterium]|nr:S-isoprenylcysteine methyltransferase [Deltaproteobacteria bacterium]
MPVSSPASDRLRGAQAAALAFGRLFFRYRDLLAPLAFAVTVAVTKPAPFAGRESADLLLDAVGVLLSLSGQALRVLVIGLAYIKRGGRRKTITADRLVCEGVFAHSRNPLYLGNILMVTGLLVIWNSPWAYLLVFSALLVAFLSVVRAEERFLLGRFGAEYVEYCKRVPRFFPDFRGFRGTLAQFDFDWRRVIRKEYGTTFAWISVVVALFVLEKVRWQGAAAAIPRVAIGADTWALAAVLWLTARWLKKTHRIDSAE